MVPVTNTIDFSSEIFHINSVQNIPFKNTLWKKVEILKFMMHEEETMNDKK